MSRELTPQLVWGWKIASYLFLAGVGAGAYVAGAVASYLGEQYVSVSRIGLFLSTLVFIGMLFLIADLGNKKNVMRVFFRVRSSWVARGSWIITIFIVLSAFDIAITIWPLTWLQGAIATHQLLRFITSLFGITTMVYTGLLLGASKPIAFWSTPILPLLFLVSASSTGLMAVMLGGTVYGFNIYSFSYLARADTILILVESLVIGLYLMGSHRVTESRFSVQMWIRGSLARSFWGGVVVCGLAIPLVIEFSLGTFPFLGEGAFTAVTALGMFLGLVGGLVMRRIVLAAGVHAPLKVGSIVVPVPTSG